MIRLRRAAIAFAASACLSGQAAAQTRLTLADAMARAAANNKTLAAARLRAAVSAADVAVAAERPNPEFTYEAARETPHQSFAFSLPIETAAKRARRIAAAQAGIDLAAATLAQAAVELRSDVRRAYFSLAAAERRADILADVRALAQRAKDAADARVAAGDAPRLESLEAGLELSSADNDLSAARADAGAARVALATLLGEPPAADLSAADDLTALAPDLGADAATALAVAASVDVALLDRQIAAAVARRNLAQALTRPDLGAGAALTYDAPGEFRFGWRASATVEVPIFTTHRAGVTVADAEVTALRAERDATVTDIAGKIAEAEARAAAAADELRRFTGDMLPRSLEIERMAEDSYRNGQTGLAALLQTVQSARTLRLRSVQAALDAQLAAADLERARGASIK